MKELLVVSGKGGTGKTSLVACFAQLSKKSLFCDCDVDASNLHLLLEPKVCETNQFYAGWLPKINQKKCINCGKCVELCRSNAIILSDGKVKNLAELCEGCCVCADNCEADAIEMLPRHCGKWFQSQTAYGELFHAELFPGEENSGKLIAELRKAAKTEATKQGVELIISDGPPGIGCPVISSMSGVDLVVVVTEPTLSGFHDFKRVALLAHQFEIPVQVVINKWDLNSEVSDKIAEFCQEHKIIVAGRIPYDKLFSQVLRNGKTVLSQQNSAPAIEIKKIWNNILLTL